MLSFSYPEGAAVAVLASCFWTASSTLGLGFILSVVGERKLAQMEDIRETRRERGGESKATMRLKTARTPKVERGVVGRGYLPGVLSTNTYGNSSVFTLHSRSTFVAISPSVERILHALSLAMWYDNRNDR